jgi:hypothetical protein
MGMIYEDMVEFAVECQALANKYKADYKVEISDSGARFSSTFTIERFTPKGEVNNVPSASKLVQSRKKPGRKPKRS